MASGMYLRRGQKLVSLSEEPFEREDLLQELLADHPYLLAGEAATGEGGRWVLLTREAGVADAPGASDRWSVDHLFVDEAGVPTLVEVKRSSDTRIRREMVGQLLDYAAHASVSWDVASLREAWEAGIQAGGGDPDDALVDAIGVKDSDSFWQLVDTNLSAGKMRLVFVADEVPRELQRVVEFLNERMVPTEVLAIEVRQYRAGEEQVLVPRLLGQTVAAQERKGKPSRSARPACAEEDIRAALETLDEPSRSAGTEIFDYLLRRGHRFFYGRGQVPSVQVWFGPTEQIWLSVGVWASQQNPSFSVNFEWLRPYLTTEELQRIADAFAKVPGVAAILNGTAAADFKRRPSIPLHGVLDQEGAATAFCAAIDALAADRESADETSATPPN